MNEPATSAAAETTEIPKTRLILPFLQRAAIPILLFALTLAVFWPATRCGFISFDDPYYVSSNPHVRAGLKPASVAWAFTTTQTANWHPVTWMSHMLDVSFFGLRPAWHHLVNVVIHALNSVLVFLLLRRMMGEGGLTQRRKDAKGGAKGGRGQEANIQPATCNLQPATSMWRCAFVAALFALHPVHVESVAWIAERKDVLSAFFGLVTLLFYVKFALDQKRQRSVASRRRAEAALWRAAEAGSQLSVERGSSRPAALGSEEDGGGQKPDGRSRKTEGGEEEAVSEAGRLVADQDGQVARSTHSEGGLNPQPSTSNYVWALVFFTLGLMSKPMLVTLPFVMLLLDWWPLKRLRIADRGLRSAQGRAELPLGQAEQQLSPTDQSSFGVFAALREKIPFFALSALFCVITFIAQRAGGAVVAMGKIPLEMRIENTFVSYARYLGKLFWPSHLALPYPYPSDWPIWLVVFSVVLTVGLCVAAIWLSRRWPFVGVGWFWFFGMLIPVIGLVQVGNQSLADRYLYLPSIGIFIVVSWGTWAIVEGGLRVSGLTQRRKDAKAGAETSNSDESRAGAEHRTSNVEGAGIGAQETNIQHSTFNIQHSTGVGSEIGAPPRSDRGPGGGRHAGRPYRAAVCGVAAVAVLALCAWDTRKQLTYWRDSVSLFAHTVDVTRNNSIAVDSLGASLFEQGKAEEALECYNLALKIHARDPLALDGLGCYWFSKGQLDKGIEYFRKVLEISTNQPLTYFNLGSALAQEGHLDEAVPYFQSAIRLQPDDPDAPYLLGNLYSMKQEYELAANYYLQAIRLKPDYVAARRGYAASLMMQGKLEEAGVEFTQLLRMMPGDPDTNLMLARIHAKLGHVWEAKVHASEVLRARPGDPEATKLLKELGQ